MHEPRGDVQRVLVVTSNWNGHAITGAISLRLEVLVAHAVEGTYDARSWEHFCRGQANTFRFGLRRQIAAVTYCDGVPCVEHDLARELASVVLADLRISAIGHGNENDITKVNGFGNCTCLRKAAESIDQRLQFFRVPGREHHWVTRFHPERSDGAANVTGPDDTDFQRGTLGQGATRNR